MQRREFLQAAGAAGLAAATFDPTTLAAEDAGPALSVRRVESDRFMLDFSPIEPRPLRILQLTDTHFGTNKPEAKLQDRRSFAEIRRMVERHRPDFLVHTGDFINNDQGPAVSLEAIEVFDDLGVPWTHALGNHDIGSRSIDEFRKPMKNAAVGEFRAGGVTEYAFRFDVHGDGKSDPSFTLFCLDSGYAEPNRRVNRAQIDWFERQMKGDFGQGLHAPCLAMIHIPVVEFEKLRAAGQHKGEYGEAVCFDNDSGDTFAALHKSGRIKGIFSGHDHKNDYCGVWQGIELVYGRVSGWWAYGELRRGGRLIEIDLASGAHSHRLVFPEA